MIGAIAKLKIKDGERDNFIEAMGNLVKAVAENEPDCFYSVSYTHLTLPTTR